MAKALVLGVQDLVNQRVEGRKEDVRR